MKSHLTQSEKRIWTAIGILRAQVYQLNQKSAGKADIHIDSKTCGIHHNENQSDNSDVRPESDSHNDNICACPRCRESYKKEGYIAGLEKAKEICFDQNQNVVTFREEDGLAIEKRILTEIEKVVKKKYTTPSQQSRKC